MFNVTLVNDGRDLIARLDQMPASVHAALLVKVTGLAFKVQAKVQNDKLSGQVLNIRSGNLKASIKARTTSTQTAVWGHVFSDGSVKYAGIHEFGGIIKHPGGTAYVPWGDGGPFGGAVMFITNQAAAEFKAAPMRTKPHDIPMPARSFLRSSLRDMEAEISLGMKQAVLDGIAKAGLTVVGSAS